MNIHTQYKCDHQPHYDQQCVFVISETEHIVNACFMLILETIQLSSMFSSLVSRIFN